MLSLSLALAGLSLAGCKKEDPKPTTTLTAQQQQLSTGSWRLDEIKQAGQVASSGSTIKDRYALTFRANGTYTQKVLADIFAAAAAAEPRLTALMQAVVAGL